MSELILIDFDNTLNDSDSRFIAQLDGLLGLRGEELWGLYLRIHREIVHKQFSDKHDDGYFQCRLIFQHLGQPYDEAVAADFIRRFRAAEESCWKDPAPYPDALVFLKEVKGRGFRLCLATGAHAQEKAAALERRAGEGLFEEAFTEKDAGSPKSSPLYYQKLLERCRARPEEAIMVGDSLVNDIAPARRVGIRTIWVNRKGETAPHNSLPSLEVQELREALAYL